MELSSHTLSLPPRLDADAVEAVAASLAAALESPDVRVLVLRGAGDCFCRGLSLGAELRAATMARFAALLLAVREAPLPTLALVDGEALGGGLGLLAACDAVVASARARFGLPESLFGLVPGMVLPLVQERVRPAAARLMALRGVTLSAEEAHRIGLVDEVSADLGRAQSRQVRLLSRPSAASVRWLKAAPDGLRAAVLGGAAETARRLADPDVVARIAAFARGEAPWEVSCSQ